MATHIDRKSLKEDAFRDTMFWMIDWVYQRRVWFIAGASAVVLLVAAGFGYYTWHRSRLQAEAEGFYRAERAAADPALSEAERQTKGRKAYEDYVAAQPSSFLAPVAWMHVARIAWKQGDAQGARKAFQAVLDSSAAGGPLRDLAHVGLATVAEASGDLAGAEEQYKAVSDHPYEELKAFSLGRVASEQQRSEEARKWFDKAAHATDGSLAEWARQNLDYHP
jgi:predicted negative regulator of RcsB-dependent stress response